MNNENNPFSKAEIECFKDVFKGIFIDGSKKGAGYTALLLANDGSCLTLLDGVSLSDALGYSESVSKLIGLPDGSTRVNKEVILKNRLTDPDAMEVSKLLEEQDERFLFN
jgi:hypothetical protein